MGIDAVLCKFIGAFLKQFINQNVLAMGRAENERNKLNAHQYIGVFLDRIKFC